LQEALGTPPEQLEDALGQPIDDVVRGSLEDAVEAATTRREVRARQAFEGDRVPEKLRHLRDNPPRLASKATTEEDGRAIPIVLAVVRNQAGATRGGIALTLYQADGGNLVDRSRTDANGIAVLKFSRRQNDADVSGTIQVLAAPGRWRRRAPESAAVTIPAGTQQIVKEIVLTELPTLPSLRDPTTGEQVEVNPESGDVLSALPSDYSTELCDTLDQLLGPVPDPILGKVAAPDDFRSSRMPLIKRLTVPRLGERRDGQPPRRYLVRLRQHWTFRGYTLGEVSNITGLDPGAVTATTTQAVERAVERVARETEQTATEAIQVVRSWLAEAATVDSLLEVATSAEARARAELGAPGAIPGAAIGGVAGGLIAGPLGILAGGLIGLLAGAIGGGAEVSAGPSVTTTTTTTNHVDTSLEVNSLLRTSSSLVNQALRVATSALRDVQLTVLRRADQVSPLLSRATNLFRWTVYQNYSVCTDIEDVLEIRDVRIVAPPRWPFFPWLPQRPVFSDEDIVDYRRYFEPVLLEPRLAPQFSILAAAIAERMGGGAPISTVSVVVDYSAAIYDADLRISIGEANLTVDLRKGATTARGFVRMTPVLAAQLQQATLTLTAKVPTLGDLFGEYGFGAFNALSEGAVRVSRIRFWFDAPLSAAASQTNYFGDSLQVNRDALTREDVIELHAPVRSPNTSTNPLVRHVNRNATYYFGVLAQAALAIPSLRDDAPQLANFNGSHELWRLPIVGFEGDRALILSEVEHDAAGNVTDPDAARILNDAGASTIIQIAAPGAYAEALQGLLELSGDATGKIHPALLPPLPPAMPPLALVDLTGKSLQIVDGTPG
jgi:hypothetical protein